ncbi:MAG: glycogen/starch synthase [Prevotellaceae bacterium]|jgi:starch synthase|nr:glycogen/starch synthase [Prevotellaceae bacterium]
MNDPIKILFVSQAISPFVPETPESKICREFPQYIQDRGCEIRTFMPCFGNINERRNQLHEVQRLSGMNLIIDDTDHPLIIKVASIQSARMQVYFIDNDDFFRRKGMLVDEHGAEYGDNDRRAIFFARGVLETIKKLRWTPDIIHCHGWLTALMPLYVKKFYNDDPFFRHSKVIYALCNDTFQTPLPKGFDRLIALSDASAPESLAAMKDKAVSYDMLTRLAIDFSDAVIIGHPEVNPQTVEYVQNKKLPYLPYNEDYKVAYTDFYNSMVPLYEEEY